MTQPAEAAQLDLRLVRRGHLTVLDRRLFTWPFTLTRSFHLDRLPADMLTVMVQTSSGAIQADDRLVQRIHVETGAAAHVTTQGATAVHRARPGQAAREEVELRVEAGGFLEYLPEPKILFPDAALSQSVVLHCRPGGRALVADAFIGHDPEGTGRGFRALDARVVVRGDDPEPLVLDRMTALGARAAARGGRAKLRAFGSLYAVLPPDGGAVRLRDRLNAVVSPIEGLYAAASLLPNDTGVGLRFAAAGGLPLRAGLEAAWVAARQVMVGETPASRRKLA